MTNIQKTFVTSAGYTGVIVLNHMGYRCGYCIIPATHVCFNLHYYSSDSETDSKTEPYLTLAQKEIDNISVHGGLTFSGSLSFPETDIIDSFGFGFDCGHAGDAQDLEAIYDSDVDRGMFIKIGLMDMPGLNNTIRTEEYVREEIESLSNQLQVIDNKYIKEKMKLDKIKMENNIIFKLGLILGGAPTSTRSQVFSEYLRKEKPTEDMADLAIELLTELMQDTESFMNKDRKIAEGV